MSYTGNKDIYVAADGFVYTEYDVALSANEEFNTDHSHIQYLEQEGE